MIFEVQINKKKSFEKTIEERFLICLNSAFCYI